MGLNELTARPLRHHSIPVPANEQRLLAYLGLHRRAPRSVVAGALYWMVRRLFRDELGMEPSADFAEMFPHRSRGGTRALSPLAVTPERHDRSA